MGFGIASGDRARDLAGGSIDDLPESTIILLTRWHIDGLAVRTDRHAIDPERRIGNVPNHLVFDQVVFQQRTRGDYRPVGDVKHPCGGAGDRALDAGSGHRYALYQSEVIVYVIDIDV